MSYTRAIYNALPATEAEAPGASNKENVIIPNTYTNISSLAFNAAKSLITVTFEAGSRCSLIGQQAFQSTTSLTTITIPNSVTIIGEQAFKGTTNLTTVTFEPDSKCTRFGKLLFYQATGLIYITIPASVTTFDDNYTFLGTSNLTSIYVEDGNLNFSSIDGILFNKDKTKLINYPGKYTSGSDITGTTYTIPSTCTSIGSSSFRNITILEELTIHAGVTNIGKEAFQWTRLNTVIFEAGSILQSIGQFAFSGATKLHTFPIPSSVTSIGKYAFKQTKLTSVTIPAGLGSIPQNTFDNIRTLAKVIFEAGSVCTSIGSDAFYNCSSTGFTSITIPASVNSIGDRAFQGATNLNTVILEPESVLATIGGSAFTSTSLSTIYAPTSVMTTFGWTVGQTDAKIGSKTNVTVYGKDRTIFFTATSSNSVNISGTLNSTDLLFAVGSITQVVIGIDVTGIGNGAFENASALTEVTFENGSLLTTIGANAFNPSGLTTVYAPQSLISSMSWTNAIGGKTGVTFEPSTVFESSTVQIGQEVINVIKDNVPILTITPDTSEISIPPPAEGLLGNVGDNDIVKSLKRTVYMAELFVKNPEFATTSAKIIMPTVDLLGSSSVITKSTMLISKASNTDEPQNTSQLAADEAIYVYMTEDDYTVFNTSVGKIKIQRINPTQYSIYENYIDMNTPITKTMSTGQFGKYGTFSYVLGSISGQIIPANLTTFSTATDISSVNISGALTSEDLPFDFSIITSVYIGNTVTSIGSGAFLNASALSTVTFEEGSTLTSIGASAFSYNSELSSITIPSSVTSIGSSAFLNASALSTVTFEEGSTLASIGNEAFQLASALTIIAIPASVTSIGDNAFYGATNLTEVTFENSSLLTTIGANVFNPSGLTTVYAEQSLISSMSWTDEIGGKTGVTFAPPPISPICFPARTPILTDQGNIAISKLNPEIHTIRGKKIVAISQTISLDKHIISIEKDAIAKNIPCNTTQISKDHKLLYKGVMTKAIDLVGVCKGVSEIHYNGEILYNVILQKYDRMVINNLICETLHPSHMIAKIITSNNNQFGKNQLFAKLNRAILKNDIPAFKKLYTALK